MTASERGRRGVWVGMLAGSSVGWKQATESGPHLDGLGVAALGVRRQAELLVVDAHVHAAARGRLRKAAGR